MKPTKVQLHIVLFLGWMFIMIPFEIFAYVFHLDKKILVIVELTWITIVSIYGAWGIFQLFKHIWKEEQQSK